MIFALKYYYFLLSKPFSTLSFNNKPISCIEVYGLDRKQWYFFSVFSDHCLTSRFAIGINTDAVGKSTARINIKLEGRFSHDCFSFITDSVKDKE